MKMNDQIFYGAEKGMLEVLSQVKGFFTSFVDKNYLRLIECPISVTKVSSLFALESADALYYCKTCRKITINFKIVFYQQNVWPVFYFDDHMESLLIETSFRRLKCDVMNNDFIYFPLIAAVVKVLWTPLLLTCTI